MPNRLAHESSPYLLQHQNNPVDWFPWGEEAFAKAKAENKPVFLSVGYSACHWCHVMEHECFEDQQVADLLNASFVSVKVDREERPDIDETYMAAVQLSTERGGWPMTVFMTPEKKPFFGGTYFPKLDQGKHPGFVSILTQLAAAWKSKRARLEDMSDSFAAALKETLERSAPATFTKLDDKLVTESVQRIASDFDRENGGFGTAPKFPPHTTVELLMLYALRPSGPQPMREAALGMTLISLENMALGGIHDHVGGGFHRYSTDEKWLVPHFEKMLYDNALMLGNYARAAGLAQELDPRLEQLFMRVARGIISFVDREMTSPEGLFYSAIDADCEGEEGKSYVWTEAEVRQLLGDRADAFLKAFNFQAEGNFEDEARGEKTGANIPHLTEDAGATYDEDLAVLLEARAKRPLPAIDDKAIVSWNGMMIGALADAGMLPIAEQAALKILDYEKAHGSLPHQIAKGKPSGLAFLDDYANFVDGLVRLASYRAFLEESREELAKEGLDLGQQNISEMWASEAARLTEEMIGKFYDEEKGGFFFTTEGHDALFGRSKPAFDQPAPSANAIAIRCLIAFGENERATKSLDGMVGWIERAPSATEALLVTALPLIPEGPSFEAVAAADAKSPAAKAEPEVSLVQKELVANPHGWGEGEIVIKLPDGIHINSNTPPARWLTPTAVVIEPLHAKIDYPPAPDEVYEGELRIPFLVKLPKGENGAEFDIKVTYQPCTETECLLPAEKRLNGVLVR